MSTVASNAANSSSPPGVCASININCDTILLFYLSLPPSPPSTTSHTHIHTTTKYRKTLFIVQIAACGVRDRYLLQCLTVASNRHREAPVIPRGKLGIRRPETASSPHRLHLVTRPLALSPADRLLLSSSFCSWFFLRQ